MRYNFICDDCNHIFEHMMGVDEYILLDYSSIPCTNCGSVKVRRTYAVPTIKFSGPGFYSTDGKAVSEDVNIT